MAVTATITNPVFVRYAEVKTMSHCQSEYNLLTEDEAAVYLRLTDIGVKNPAVTLRNYRETGKLRPTKISNRILYSVKSLNEFIELQTK